MRNRLLAALPRRDYDRVGRTLEALPLQVKDVLQRPGEPTTDVYFPADGFCSILTRLEDRSLVEIATVGREGMVGVLAILDVRDGATSLTMVQASIETCYRMSVADFRDEMDRRGRFHALLTRYAHAHLAFVMQSTACNARHSVEQRLARWLLLAHDRVGGDEFALTQEFAAMMLGASRPMVTTVAGSLQRRGLVSYHRGLLRILDRKRLEAVACECYRITTRRLDDVIKG
jgi:CRP-like cAMP-binding protein